MMQLVAEGMDVAEIYSPPRVVKHAQSRGLRAGWSLDLTNHDVDGKAWDFTKPEMRSRLWAKLKKDKPLLVIGSPACTDWSTMMNLNWHRMSEEDVKRRMKEARVHLKFCIEVYKYQTEHSRYFLHEHPSAARSWKEPAMQKLMKMQDAILTKADQCQYGLIVEDMKGQSHDFVLMGLGLTPFLIHL